jgi:phage host-nuclease inhibitor protein Gam
VIREDVGTGKDYKQAATDAFKRAAVRFGIGHELYAYEQNWVQMDGDGKYAKPVEDPAVAYARRYGRLARRRGRGGPPVLTMETSHMRDTREHASEPHILDGIDDDVTQDLAAIGVELVPNVEQDLDDERRHAMAALLLRRAGGVDREIASIQRTMELELEAVRAHYERQLMPLRTRRRLFLDFVENLAALVQWKKKKSAATPYGTFGVKDRAATVKLADPDAVLAWAREERREVVRVVVTLPLAEAYQYFTDDELARAAKVELEWGKLKASLDVDGALPPGVERVAAVREPFAAPAELAS